MPLSTGQERLWYLSQVQEPGYTYNEQMEIRVSGSLDISFLESSLKIIVERHEVLRTVFVQTDKGELRQIIKKPFSVEVPLISLGEESADEESIEREIGRFSLRQGRLPYDLTNGPLFRACVLQLPRKKQVFLFSYHHIILDGRALAILLNEINILYETKLSRLAQVAEPLPIQCADYACWEQQWMKTKEFSRRLDYWKEHLSDLPPLLDIPVDYPRPTKDKNYGAWEYISLPKKLTKKLLAMSWQEKVAPYIVILAAYKILLKRYSGQNDVVVGTIMANRLHCEIKDLLGFFAETIVLRSNLSDGKTFRELLCELNTLSHEAFHKQAVPFSKLVETLRANGILPKEASPVQATLVFNSIPFNKGTLAGKDIRPPSARQMGVSKFDITLSLDTVDDSLKGYFEYNTNLFKPQTVKRFLRHFHLLLESMIEDPGQDIANIPLLTGDENRQIVIKWNDTEARYPHNQCIHQLFEAQVEQTPGAVAVVYEDQQLTYEELNNRSNQLAHYLIEHGVNPEARVGLCLQRSFEMIIGMLGILKAGGAYVPIDPEYPQQRIDYLLKDSGVALLLTQANMIYNDVEDEALACFCLDRDWIVVSSYSSNNPAVRVNPINLAYIIYTSGSTGKPKGVAVPHRAVNRLLFNNKYMDLDSGRTILQTAPISFDAATFEIWAALLHGAKCVLYGERIPTPEKLEEVIVSSIIDTLWLTTALFNLIVDEKPEVLSHVKYVMTGGEAVSTEHIKRAYERCGNTQFMNMYGPTENTTFTSYYSISSQPDISRTIPIGKPVGNTSIYILDIELNPVPIGVAGELYTGGEGLARGYLDRPELTAEKFIPNPFSKRQGERLYRTGDLVCYLPDGNIQFLCRIDNQVKVRGYRIELGEIESALMEQPGVRSSIVLALTYSGTPESKYLTAYVVPEDNVILDQNQLRHSLGVALPGYMVPSFFVFLFQLPLTTNGKVDHKALPIPDASSLQTQAYVAPRTETERVLVCIWEDILDLSADKVGIDDDFFELGGHSLLATRVVSQIRKIFLIELQIKDLFTANTVRALAAIVEESITDKQVFNILTSKDILDDSFDMDEVTI